MPWAAKTSNAGSPHQRALNSSAPTSVHKKGPCLQHRSPARRPVVRPSERGRYAAFAIDSIARAASDSLGAHTVRCIGSFQSHVDGHPHTALPTCGHVYDFPGHHQDQDGGTTDFVYVKIRGSCLEPDGTWRGCPSYFVDESCGGYTSATRRADYFCSELGLNGPPTWNTVRTRADGYIIHHMVQQKWKIRYSTTALIKCP
jgi:hypothetical protein